MTGNELLAHRALVAAVVHGVLDVEHAARLIVRKHDASFEHAVDADDVIAVVVSSPTAAALASQKHGTVDTDTDTNGDARASSSSSPSVSVSVSTVPCFSEGAYSRAVAWAAPRAGATIGPPLDHAQLHAFVAAAHAAGLTLVVPDVTLASPPLGQLAQTRFPRTAVARAALHIYARGSLAFPLLFVPHARAPKNGLPKSKLDRIADGWVSGSASLQATMTPALGALAPIVAVAVGVLSAGGPPIMFKELLRAAREVNGAATADAKQLSAALYRLWLDGAVELFAIDPQRHLPFDS